MKLTILILCITLCAVNSQIPPVVPPIGALGVPPLGLPIPPLGLPFPGMGPGFGFGLPFGPFGPFGLPFLPFLRPGFGLRRFGGLGMGLGLLGKRSVDDSVPVVNGTETESNRTLCNYSSKKQQLACHGLQHNFECDVQENLVGLENIKLRLADLRIVPETVKNVEFLRILARRSMMTRMTAVNPMTKKDLLLSFYHEEHVSEPGFLIKDQKCWSQFESMVKGSGQEDVRLALFVHQ